MKTSDTWATVKGAIVGLGFMAISTFAVLIGYQLLAPANPAEALTNSNWDEQTKRVAPPILAQPIQMQTSIEVPRYFLGQVEAEQTASLGFEFGGKLVDITVDEGDVVVEGQMLASLDTQLLLAEQGRLFSMQEVLKSHLAFVNEAFERSENLLRRGLGNAGRHDDVRLARSELSGNLIEIEAALKTTDIRMEKSVLRAPFDGVIGARLSDQGENIAAGQPLLSIFGQSPLNFRIGLPPQIDPAALKNPKIEIDGQAISANLISVRQDIDPETRTRTVIYQLTDVPPGIAIGRPGTLVAATTLDLNGAWVPINAMRADLTGVWTVMTVGADDIVRMVAVEVLYLGDDQAFVFGAFESDENVIVGGAHKVTVGQTVKVDQL